MPCPLFADCSDSGKGVWGLSARREIGARKSWLQKELGDAGRADYRLGLVDYAGKPD